MGAIIIGDGGVGKVVLMKLRQRIVEEYGSLSACDWVKFLHLDTFADPTPEPGQNFHLKVLEQDITLKPPERVILSEGLGPGMELASDPHVASWFPPGLPVNIDFKKGAGGIRPYGRLCFHWNVNRFREKLKNLLTNLDGDRDIYLVCSLFGGTGSGTYLDVCYLIRQVMAELGVHGEFQGYLVIGSAMTDARMEKNCYAALMELEYYTTGAILKDIDQSKEKVLGLHLERYHQPFEARYPIAGVPEIISDQAPFDNCYLFTQTNRLGDVLDRTDLEEMISQRIFLETTPGIGNTMRAPRLDGKQNPSYYLPDYLLQRAKCFFATGCAIIEFPAPRLINAMSAGLAAYCFHHLLYTKASGFPDLKGEIKEFLTHHLEQSLAKTELIRQLERQDTTLIRDSIGQEQHRWMNELESEINRKDFDPIDLKNNLERIIDQASATFRLGSGAYSQIINTNLDNLWRKIELSLDAKIIEYLINKDIGPQKDIDFIASMMQELARDVDSYRQMKESADKRMRQADRQRINQRLRKIEHDLSPKYKFELKKHVQWLCREELPAFMNSGFEHLIYQAMETLNRRIINRLDHLRQEISTYLNGMKLMRESLTQEMQSICRNLLSWIGNESTQVIFSKLADILKNLGSQDLKDHPEAFYRCFVQPLSVAYGLTDPLAGGLESAVDEIITTLNGPNSKTQDYDQQVPSLLYQVIHQPDDLKGKLLEICRNRFDYLKKEVNICDLITRMDQEQQNRLLEYGKKMAEWALQLFPDHTTDHDPNLCQWRWIGVPNEVDIIHHPIWDNDQAADYSAGRRQRHNSLQEPYRLVFTTEITTFSMRNIRFLETYGRQFMLLPEAKQKQMLTNRQINFPDILPPHPDLQQIHLRSERASLLGRLFGLLREEDDPDNHYPAIYLYYNNHDTGSRMIERLVDAWEKVIPGLRKAQVDKQIKHLSSHITPLEILEREIDQRASSANTKEEKEELWQKTQKMLDQIEEEVEDERHPSYQRALRLLDDFRTKCHLKPPEINTSHLDKSP